MQILPVDELDCYTTTHIVEFNGGLVCRALRFLHDIPSAARMGFNKIESPFQTEYISIIRLLLYCCHKVHRLLAGFLELAKGCIERRSSIEFLMFFKSTVANRQEPVKNGMAM